MNVLDSLVLFHLIYYSTALVQIEDIFRQEKPKIYGERKDQNGPKRETNVPDSCMTAEGGEGFCVTRRRCNQNNTIITDGYFLSPRKMTVLLCPDTAPVCCMLPENHPMAKTTTSMPTTVVTSPASTPVAKEEVSKSNMTCGWRGKHSGLKRRRGAAFFGEFPWTVAVYQVYSAIDEEFKCTGSLIHSLVVMTTAKFFKRSGSWQVRAGELDLADASEPYPHQISNVKSVVISNFSPGGTTEDIALLFLATPILPDDYIGFACLPAPAHITPPGTRCITTGWGIRTDNDSKEDNLMKMEELSIEDLITCQQRLLSLRMNIGLRCAGVESDPVICLSYGAPLVCEDRGMRGRYYQAGIVIVSSRLNCRNNFVPKVYTDVSALRPWVDQQMAIKGYGNATYTLNY